MLAVLLLGSTYLWLAGSNDAPGRGEAEPLPADVELATTTSTLDPAQTPLLKVGRETTVVAADLTLRDGCQSTTVDELDACLVALVERTKRQMRQSELPYDAIATVAADRCVPAQRVTNVVKTAAFRAISKFKLMGLNGASRVVINTVVGAADGDVWGAPVVRVGAAGIDIVRLGERLKPKPPCDPAGPTVCAKPTGGPCGGVQHDWEGFRDRLLEIKALEPDETVILVGPGAGGTWQSIIDAMDAARWRDKESQPWEELFADAALIVR